MSRDYWGRYWSDLSNTFVSFSDKWIISWVISNYCFITGAFSFRVVSRPLICFKTFTLTAFLERSYAFTDKWQNIRLHSLWIKAPVIVIWFWTPTIISCHYSSHICCEISLVDFPLITILKITLKTNIECIIHLTYKIRCYRLFT